MFHHHRLEPEFSPIIIAHPMRFFCIECLLELKLTSDFKWNSYIETITKIDGKMVGTLYYIKKYLTLPAIFYRYKNQTNLPFPALTDFSHLHGLVDNELFSTHLPYSPQMKYCKAIATQLLFP